MKMKYRTLTLIALLVALITGMLAQALVNASLKPGPAGQLIGLVSFVGGAAGGLFGFVGIFRVREGKSFFPRFF
jgi:uncharacterized membrane protein YeaQ/YmgE (transglycosylase-associated protein family)